LGVGGLFPFVERAFFGEFFFGFKRFQPSKVNLPGKQDSPPSGGTLRDRGGVGIVGFNSRKSESDFHLPGDWT